MGILLDGIWQEDWDDSKNKDGKFQRQASQFRHTISAEQDAVHRAESGRYHLYVSMACPWAHRTLIFRKLKGLEAHIDVSVVSPDMLQNGWSFDDFPGATADKLFAYRYLHQLYTRAQADISSKVTVPVLWDKKLNTIVNNESAEIIRIFNSSFDELSANTLDFYPAALREQIDQINDFVYHNINNGVYKAGFATTQTAYQHAVEALFSALDKLDAKLAHQPYLCGNQLTEADWRLFTTLIRFDAVYVGHFKCNIRRIVDYPNLSAYLRDLYQYPGIAETVNFTHIKRHYYFSHTKINPTQVVPLGPEINLLQDPNREQLR